MGPALLQSECKVKRNISKLQILRGVFAFFCVFNKKIARQHNACKQLLSGWEDSNFRPPRPERGALTNCATPRVGKPIAKLHQFFEIATIFCNFYFFNWWFICWISVLRWRFARCTWLDNNARHFLIEAEMWLLKAFLPSTCKYLGRSSRGPCWIHTLDWYADEQLSIFCHENILFSQTIRYTY